MEVKDIITNRRTELGLTMKELADMVGVSEGTISRWESGEIENMRRDKIATLEHIAWSHYGMGRLRTASRCSGDSPGSIGN